MPYCHKNRPHTVCSGSISSDKDNEPTSVLWYWILKELETISLKKLTTLFFFVFFRYIIDPIQWYNHQHHSLLSAIDTLLLSLSFKPTFVDLAFLFNMLALLAVFILSSCVCVVFIVGNKVTACVYIKFHHGHFHFFVSAFFNKILVLL